MCVCACACVCVCVCVCVCMGGESATLEEKVTLQSHTGLSTRP